MKNIFFTIALILSVLFLSYGQSNNKLKIGGYKYSFEYKNNSPSNNFQFRVEKRTKEEIINYGGNDYKVLSVENKVSLREIKREYFGVFDGENFFINAYPFTGYFWYSKAECFGKYIYFKGVPPLNKKIQNKIGFEKTSYALAFTVIGGAIGGGIARTIEETQNAKERIPILLNVESGEAIFLTKDRLYNIISNYPDLKQDYFSEPDYNEKVIIKIINKLNEKDIDLSFSAADIDDKKQSNFEKQMIDLESFLYKTEEDSSYQIYYDRIIKLTNHPKFEKTKLDHKEYSNGNLKSIGLKAKQKLGEYEDDLYETETFFSKIGTWRYFYSNGQLKLVVNYNLIGKRDGKYVKFDKTGNLRKEIEYQKGKKIKKKKS